MSDKPVAPTFEEAKRCPKCQLPGDDRSTLPARGMPRGTTVHTIYCVNDGCPWYNTPWMVQVNPDGSVPPPQDHTRTSKIYQGFEKHDQLATDIREALRLDAEKETQEGGREIRRR